MSLYIFGGWGESLFQINYFLSLITMTILNLLSYQAPYPGPTFLALSLKIKRKKCNPLRGSTLGLPPWTQKVVPNLYHMFPLLSWPQGEGADLFPRIHFWSLGSLAYDHAQILFHLKANDKNPSWALSYLLSISFRSVLSIT